MEISKATRNYIYEMLPKSSGLEAEMEEYAKENHIPIMDAEGLHTMLTIMGIAQPKNILEVGTAIGYSAIRMLHAAPEAVITSIERDEERSQLAEENIKKAGLEDRFHLIKGDALESASQVAEKAPYDILFIDAAKGQYESFFNLFEPLVNENGIIFSDNVLFQGYVAGEKEMESRRFRAMVKRLDQFNKNIMNNPRFASTLLPVGDGLLVTRKCKSI
ncbi:O-methyltransferase [Alkalicoccus daliensis]|uniref:tRNA 5-hydroxyuridine methyltransferase n=1 Tax=Alkalicoccus daliensis TaxID=745820 RepID=A0A1H0BIG0_9BACI|nr:O-methyltransferase [Alkalicoccus daliensis]SDN45429.1 Predicted O-methyltransferase YrrM [Alkalicoccus daliensis]